MPYTLPGTVSAFDSATLGVHARPATFPSAWWIPAAE